MSERARKRRDFIQNLTIALLSVLAVLLFAQTQLHNLGISLLPVWGENELLAGSSAPNQSGLMLPSPVRVAVTGTFGRYGNVTLTTADEEFEPLRGLLEQALGSARDYLTMDEKTFFDALEGPSVYYDFLVPLPLSVLTGLVQTTGGEEDVSARQLVIAERGKAVVLYLRNDTSYVRCDTALSLEMLEEVVNHYELGNASFAFEIPGAQTTAPCSLFLAEEPVLPELSVSVPLTDTDRLLTAFGFNPNTQNRYVDPSGAEVVIENGRTLRIRSNGTMIYQSGGDPALSVSAADETPTRLEAAAGVGNLLNNLLSDAAGDAALYLESIRQVGGATVLQYGYQVGGVPVCFSDGQSAAQVTLSNTSVSAMTIRVRQYTAGSTESLLLPLRQALAIAARQEGAELAIGYADRGTDTAGAQWLAE